MRKTLIRLIFFSVILPAIPTLLFAGGAGTSTAMTLLETSGARATALGEALTAISDEISGFGYNPASLQTLKSGQASIFYRSGIADESFGQLMIGSPVKNGSVGFSVGYFNGGEFDLFDGVSQRTVEVQRDLSVGLGYSFSIGKVDLGVTGKYLSSQLAETETATAYAADAGIQITLYPRLRFGSSIQNIGTQLKYKEQADNLPRLLRTGASFLLIPGRSSTRLLVDGVYNMNDSQLYPALGLEQSFGLLSFRGGYKGSQDLNQFSLGMGVLVSRFTFDYSFGIVNELDSTHLLSLSTRFDLPMKEGFVRSHGDSQQRSSKVGKEKISEQTTMTPNLSTPPSNTQPGSPSKSRVYLVKEGDTLQSIAERQLGKRELWKMIYYSNLGSLQNSTSVQAGQKILLPVGY